MLFNGIIHLVHYLADATSSRFGTKQISRRTTGSTRLLALDLLTVNGQINYINSYSELQNMKNLNF